MISAVAARRAAKAAAAAVVAASDTLIDNLAQTSLQSLPQSPSSSSSSEHERGPTNGSSPNKRKRPPKDGGRPKKKRKVASYSGETLNEYGPEESSFGLRVISDGPATRTTIIRGPVRGFSPSRPVGSDSDAEDDMSDLGGSREPLIASAAAQHPSVVGTYTCKPSVNYFPLSDEDRAALGLSFNPAVMLVMQPRETLSFIGTTRLYVLGGSAEVFGTTLTTSAIGHAIFAPRSHALPVITAMPASSGTRSSTTPPIPQWIQEKCTSDTTLIVLQELRTGVEGLGTVCPVFDGIFSGDSNLGIDGFHPVTQNIFELQAFTLPRSWDSACFSFCPPMDISPADALSPRVALVKGSKNVGKSTFAKTLLNRLVERYHRVAFLECDVGQPEFTPPGMVALHVVSRPVFGPSFTHLIQPFRAHYIGSSTARSDPAYYLTAIEALLQTFRLELQFIPPADIANAEDGRNSDVVPLIVNTMGWSKGLGASLVQRIEEMVAPTHVFAFTDPAERLRGSGAAGHSDAFPVSHFPVSNASAEVELHTLHPIPPSSLQLRYNAAALRALSNLSYLYMTPASSTSDVLSWSTTLPLCSMLPWEVECRAAFDQVFLIGPGSEDVVPDEVPTVLNGALVALVATDEQLESQHPTSAIPYSQSAFPPSPSTSHCVGLALIRSVVDDGRSLHLLTSLPPSSLSYCRILVKGELELPIWGFLDHREVADGYGVAGVEWSKVPFLEWGRGQGVGGERRRVRRNLMRKNQM